MYNNVGKLIGYYRRKKYDQTKLTQFSQVGFVFFEDRLICAQSKLSIIENGKVRIPYPDEYDYLIKNLSDTPIDYQRVEVLYTDFTQKLFNTLQTETQTSLIAIQKFFLENLVVYDHVFYLRELNTLFACVFNAYLGKSLPHIDFLDDYLDCINCFPAEIQFFILDLSNLIIENYIPIKDVRDKVNGLLDQLTLDAPIVKILKASRNLRQLKLIDVQQKLKSILSDDLNDLLRFRIERLLFMIEIDGVDQLSKYPAFKNPALKYVHVNRFERCRPFLISGYLRYALKDYTGALADYHQAQIINPETVCFSLIFIGDCLYELKRMGDLNPYLYEAEKHIQHFSSLHKEVLIFFNIIHGAQNSPDESIQFKALFSNLSQLNSESPYIRIIRKHLLNYAKKNHKYKLIFDYELMMLDNT